MLDVVVDVEYSAAQQAELDDQTYYVAWVLIGSDTSTYPADRSNELDDRSAVIVDLQQYVKNSDVPGLIRSDVQARYYRHYRQVGVQAGRTDIKGAIEDGYCWEVPFTKLTFFNSVIIDAKFQVVAYNASTGDFFPIQEYEFDVLNNSSFITNQFNQNSTNQIIQIDARRGYDLENDDQFNYAIWNTETPTDEGNERHNVLIGFKINWEEWLALQGVDQVFFDQNSPFGNNGYNKETTHYQANGYTIRTFLNMNLETPDGSVTNYIISGADSTIYSYHEDGREKPEWECKIETFDETGTDNFGGLVKTDENTLIRATFTPLSYTAGLTYFAVLRMDDELGSEFSIRELSSMTTTPTAFNPASPISELIPLPGETGSKITDTGSAVTVECLVDYTKVENGKCYKISARLWKEGIGEFPGDPIVKSQDGLPIVLSQATYEELKVAT